MITEYFDLPILDWIRSFLTCPMLDRLMPVITALGNGGILWIAIALVLLVQKKYRDVGIAMLLSLGIGLLVCNLGMKPLFARIRPFDYQLQHFGRVIPLLIEAPRDYSFPSGHTIASFEAAVVLLRLRRKWGIAALVVACAIAFSRLYLYVHYPTDVLCAIVLGTGIGLAACHITNKLLRRKKLGDFE